MRLSDRPTVQGDVEIDAPRAIVWALVTDPARMGEFSPENTGGAWDVDCYTFRALCGELYLPWARGSDRRPRN